MAERARSGPHAGQPVQRAGEPLEQARAALILLHGRGATAGSILALADEIGRDGFAYLAPQAAGHTWYPYPFTAPLAANEPFLSSALALVGRVVAEVMEAGIPEGRIALAGFRRGRVWRWNTPRDTPALWRGAGVQRRADWTGRRAARLRRGARRDAGVHRLRRPRRAIPLPRVQHSADVLARVGGAVTRRIYPVMGHTINETAVIRPRAAVRVVSDEV